MRPIIAFLFLVLFLLPTGCRWAGSYTVTEDTFHDAGEAYLNKDWLGAYTLFRRCRRKQMHEEEAAYHEALCLAEMGRYEKARTRLRELQDDVTGVEWQRRIELAMARAREDKPVRAERMYTDLERSATGLYRGQVMAAHADFRVRIGDIAGAGELRRGLARMYPSSPFLPVKPAKYAVQSVQTYQDRQDAERARAVALKAGFDSAVLPSSAPGQPQAFVVQYGSFNQQDGAKNLLRRLRERGFAGIIR